MSKYSWISFTTLFNVSKIAEYFMLVWFYWYSTLLN